MGRQPQVPGASRDGSAKPSGFLLAESLEQSVFERLDSLLPLVDHLLSRGGEVGSEDSLVGRIGFAGEELSSFQFKHYFVH